MLLSRSRALLLAKELSGALNRGIFAIIVMAYSVNQIFPTGASTAVRAYFLLVSLILAVFWILERQALTQGLARIERSLLQIELLQDSRDAKIWAGAYADMKYDLERGGALAVLLRSTGYEPLIWLIAAIGVSFLR
jgi:hypothetical protein